jgi:c-di-GMP-related signal transduction protein
VEGLHLDDAVSGALLARSGDLGSALTLVEAVEMLNPERVQQTARDLDLDLEDLQDMDGHAHAWVHDLVRE